MTAPDDNARQFAKESSVPVLTDMPLPSLHVNILDEKGTGSWSDTIKVMEQRALDPVPREVYEEWLRQDNDPLDEAVELITAPISKTIWDQKYRFKRPDDNGEIVIFDKTPYDSMKRIAGALSECETKDSRPAIFRQFYKVLKYLHFLPAGRIIAGSGTGRDVTLFNCFVMGTIPDDLSGIFEMLREAALTMQQGGGIGYDFSTLRYKGAPVRGVDADASGPLTFMDVWDAMCRTIMSAGARRGAMMATMRIDHPDIELFIEAKADPKRLRMFNLSVLVTDAFMEAKKADADWDLVWEGKVIRTVRARDLWEKIMRSTFAFAEPGVIFIDRINKLNNLRYVERISATNPCGEQPLPPYGACLLGSVNLASMVVNEFEDDAHLDMEVLRNAVHQAVRMMDNVVDTSKFPLPQQEAEAKAKRRIGLGVTGVADALAMLKVVYGSDIACTILDQWMEVVQIEAYRTSVELAKEKGAFPLFNADEFLAEGTHASTLPEWLKAEIREHGIRNALLTSIAPTGTISLFANNVSSGIEPMFSFEYERKVLNPDGTHFKEMVRNISVAKFRAKFGDDVPLPDYFVDAQTLHWMAHIKMQATAQRRVDSSISKTVNLPEDITFEEFGEVYETAYDMGCKGCTTYRPNEITGSVLAVKKDEKKEPEVLPPVPMSDTLVARPGSLPGETYKVKWADMDHAYYITINDIEEDDFRRPYEIFINTKNVEHIMWTQALTRMISAVFRRGGDISFVPDELKQIFDPRGGAWMPGQGYVPSLLAAIGNEIDTHFKRHVGPIKKATTLAVDVSTMSEDELQEAMARLKAEMENRKVPLASHVTEEEQAVLAEPEKKTTGFPAGGKFCTHCNTPGSLFKEQGCEKCLNCGHSKCG